MKKILYLFSFLCLAYIGKAQSDSTKITYQITESDTLERTQIAVFEKNDLVRELQLLYSQKQQIIAAFNELEAQIKEKQELLKQFEPEKEKKE